MGIDSDRNIISAKKVFSNLRRFGWAILLCFLAALLFVMAEVVKEREKGQEVCVNTLIQAQQKGVDISEGVNVTAETVSQEFKLYIATNSVRSLLNDQLEGMGYTPLGESDKIDFAVTGNVIELTVQGKELEREQYLSQLIFQEMVSYYESDGMFSGLRLLDTSIVQLGARSFFDVLISAKSLFIIVLGLIIGVFVLALIICFDRKIYVEEEFPSTDGCRCLGVVGKRNRKQEVKDLRGVLRHLCENNRISVVILDQIKKGKMFFGEKIEFILLEDMIDKLEKEELKDTQFILAVRSGKDRKESLRRVLAYFSNLDITLMGYILVEE